MYLMMETWIALHIALYIYIYIIFHMWICVGLYVITVIFAFDISRNLKVPSYKKYDLFLKVVTIYTVKYAQHII